MSKKHFGKVAAVLMAMAVSATSVAALASCGEDADEVASYTYHGYSTALGNNWNPHTWNTSADNTILSYVSTPFVDASIKDSENQEYQWVYEMATSVTDVTAEHQDDLTKYNVTLQDGKTAETTTEGFVFEIALNKDAKWENGVAITADDYIYSMKELLNSKMRNYRSNLYWSGESAVAGGYEFYNSEAPIYDPVVPAYSDTPDYSFDIDAAMASGTLYISLDSSEMTLTSYSLNTLYNTYCTQTDELTAIQEALEENENAYGYSPVTADNYEDVKKFIAACLTPFGIDVSVYPEEDALGLYKEAMFYFTGNYGDKVEYDGTVGCYKVDDYTIRYVNDLYIDQNYFMTSLTSNWLVYEPLYEELKDTTGELVTTTYGTSVETTMSYGTYRLESYQDGKQIVFVQNENWYGFEKQDDGSLISYTQFEVDGQKVQQYQTTKIVIDVMDDNAAKSAFLKGDLSEWSPDATELSQYSMSDRLLKAPETYTMSFFFDTNLNSLKAMDKDGVNKNGVVLSNTKFRKAFSLSIDRADWVSTTGGYVPTYGLMNTLYYYDVYNDPSSLYRNSDEAMQAICNLYGVEYGEGKTYSTLKEAYDSITGYNLTEAKQLMKEACDELVAAGLYTAGDAITIKIAYAKGALTSDNNAQVAKMNEYINAAAEGSGFGKITFEAVGNVSDRYTDVATGVYAIGYGAWGGAAFYPFRNMQVYCDPDSYDLQEADCWDPTTETLTINIDGEDVTMTWQDWSNSTTGSGKYANASFDIRLKIVATMEEEYLSKYYRIPLASSTSCSLVSYQVDYYTTDYNIMYGYGGIRLLTYNYSDAEWEDYVAEQGGTLSYN